MRILAAVAVLLLAAGCASNGQTPQNQPAVHAAGATAAPVAGGIGSTITVRTRSTTITVKLVSVLDPATPAASIHVPAGSRLVGVQLELSNQGPALFQDGSLPGLSVYDTQGRRLNLHVNSGVAGVTFSHGLDAMELYVNEYRAGFALAETTAGSRVALITYTPASGTTATWIIN